MTTWTDPRTWLAGEKLTSALLNQYLRDQQRVLSEAWPDWTPTVSGLTTPGNLTITGDRIIVGKLCFFQIVLTIGSTTTPGAGTMIFSLPAAIPSTNQPVGQASIFDGSTTPRQFGAYANTTTTFACANDSGSLLSGTVPLALGTGDTVKINGVVQLA